jgi:hypothetical protein
MGRCATRTLLAALAVASLALAGRPDGELDVRVAARAAATVGARLLVAREPGAFSQLALGAAGLAGLASFGRRR